MNFTNTFGAFGDFRGPQPCGFCGELHCVLGDWDPEHASGTNPTSEPIPRYVRPVGETFLAPRDVWVEKLIWNGTNLRVLGVRAGQWITPDRARELGLLDDPDPQENPDGQAPDVAVLDEAQAVGTGPVAGEG